MPYDSALDEKGYAEEKEFDGTKISVGVYRYNHGVPKLQISRENRSMDGEWRFAKLGRMVKDEVEAVLPMIQNAIKKMADE